MQKNASDYFQRDQNMRKKRMLMVEEMIIEIFPEKYLIKILEAEIQPMQRSDLTTAVQISFFLPTFLLNFSSFLKPANRYLFMLVYTVVTF